MDFLNDQIPFGKCVILVVGFLAIETFMLGTAIAQTNVPVENHALTPVPSIMATPAAPTQKPRNGTGQTPNTKDTLVTNKGRAVVPVYSPAISSSNALGPISEMPRQNSVSDKPTTPAAPIAANGNAYDPGLLSVGQSITLSSATPLGPISERPGVASESNAPAQRLVIQGNHAIANNNASGNDLQLRGTADVGINPATPNVVSLLSTQPQSASSVQPNGTINSTVAGEPATKSIQQGAEPVAPFNTDSKGIDTRPDAQQDATPAAQAGEEQSGSSPPTQASPATTPDPILGTIAARGPMANSSAVALSSPPQSNDAPNESHPNPTPSGIGPTPHDSPQPTTPESSQSSQQAGTPLDQTASSTSQGGAESATATAKIPDVVHSMGESSPSGAGSLPALGRIAASSEDELTEQSIDNAFRTVQSAESPVRLPASESTLPTILAQDPPPPPHIESATGSTPIILFALPVFALLLLTYVGLRCA
jgi:hypothetical protein